MSEEKQCYRVILFDGVCNLCDRSVQFVLRRDPDGEFCFASLQSTVARDMLSSLGRPNHGLSGIALIEGEQVFTKSTAALRIVRRWKGLWPILSTFLVVPRPLRDWVYDWVARNRYRWFGKRDSCRLPAPEARERFLDWKENRR